MNQKWLCFTILFVACSLEGREYVCMSMWKASIYLALESSIGDLEAWRHLPYGTETISANGLAVLETCRAKCHLFCSAHLVPDFVPGHHPRCSTSVGATHVRDRQPALCPCRKGLVVSSPPATLQWGFNAGSLVKVHEKQMTSRVEV